MLTYGELFAGVGGFSIGFDQAGWTPKFQVEWDAHCQQTLRYHWPDVPKWGDVSGVSGFDLPPVDLIAFGSPCQDLSVAGKRAGLEGERSGLFHEAIRIINEMKEATGGQYPRWVVWENVAGAFSSGRGDDFETVLKEMGNLGCHHLEWHCLDAQFFGVPQRRRRVFVVACLDSRILGRGGTEIFSVGEGRRRNPAKGNKTGQEVAGTLGGGSGSRGWSPDTDRMTFIPGDEPQIVDAVTAKWAKGSGGPAGDECQNMVVEPFVKSRRAQNPNDDETWVGDAPSPTLNAFDNTGESRATVLMIDGRRQDDVRVYEPPMQTMGARMGTGDNNVPMLAQDPIVFSHTQGLDTQPSDVASHTLRVEESGMAILAPDAIPIQDGREIEKQQNGLGVGAEGEPSYTLDQTGAQAVAHQMHVRRLTPTECERLMGWPDNHTLHRADGKTNSDTTRYKMCGNGVASPVAAWLAHHINQAEHELA